MDKEILSIRRMTNTMRINKYNLKWSLIFTYILGLLAHGFAFLNFQPSNDSLYEGVLTETEVAWKLGLGRYMIPVYDKIFGVFSYLPWSGGIVALLWISISVYFVVEVLGIEKKWQIALISGIMSTNITIIVLVATYGHDLGPDAMALLLAVFSCWLWRQQNEYFSARTKLLFGIASSVCLGMMLGLYQAYLCVYVSLVLICLMLDLIEKPQKWQWVKAIVSGLIAAIPVIVGGLAYYIGVIVVDKITGLSLSVGKANSLTNLWNNEEGIYVRVLRTYYQIKGLFMDMPGYVYSDNYIQTINKILLLGGFLALVGLIIKLIKIKSGIMNVLSIIALLMILPFTMNGMRMLNPLVHDLMIYACWFVYIIVFLLTREVDKRYKTQCFEKIIGGGIMPGDFIQYTGSQ